MSPAAAVTQKCLTLLPPTERAPLVLDAASREVPASSILNPLWLAEQMRLRGQIWGASDPHVLGTLWWYSASNWLVLPTLTSLFLATEVLSPTLDDLYLHHRPDSRIVGASSTRICAGDAADALVAALDQAIISVERITGKGCRRLWSIAIDSIAGRLLWAGRATGRTEDACDLAVRLVTRMHPRLPRPRFVAVRSDPVVRRGSCCLLYRVEGQAKCGDCPRQRPEIRTARLLKRDRQ